MNDTGVLSAKALVKFANNAVCAKTVEGGVVGTRQYRSIEPSVAVMWTDRPENVELFHAYLNLHTVPRYQGAVLLDDDVSYGEFLGFCARWSCSATTAGSGRLQKIIGTGLDAYHGLGEWLQLLYARTRQRCAGMSFNRVGGSIGVLLILVLLALLFTRDAAVTPVADQKVSYETSRTQSLPKAAEPAGRLMTGVGAAPGNNTPAGLKSGNYSQRKGPTDLTAMNLANQGSTLATVSYAPFTVQVGSFRNAASAAGLVGRLKSRGYLAFVNIAQLSDGRTTHRVRVGGFQTRRGASAFGDELKQREPFIKGFFVAVNK